jgi:hypothetical protein
MSAHIQSDEHVSPTHITLKDVTFIRASFVFDVGYIVT